MCIRDRFYFVGPGYLYGFQWAGNRLQVAPRQVQVNRRVFKLGVSEKYLDGAQIGAGFQHVSGEAMSAMSHGR